MKRTSTTTRTAAGRSLLQRLLGREEGQSLVELGFLLPIFLVIAVGVVEVADSMNSYITLVDAARDGARLGSKNLATDAEIENLILTETGRLRDPVSSGDITITHTTQDGDPAVRVRVCNQRSLLLSIPLVMPDSFTMCSETTMRVLQPGA